MLSPKDKLTADYEQLQHLEKFTKELRESVQERASRETPSEDEQREIVQYRSRADELYRDAGLVGSPMPLPFERADNFRKRVLGDLARIGKSEWAGVDMKGAKSYGLKDGELREINTSSRGGHRQVDFVGGKGAWFGNTFRREPGRVELKSRQEYNSVMQNNALSKIASIIPGYTRKLFGHTNAQF